MEWYQAVECGKMVHEETGNMGHQFCTVDVDKVDARGWLDGRKPQL